jgi:SAM-dependent methyltransferase
MAESVYDEIGEGYALRRQPDPRIAKLIVSALGDARTVINVGAGTGSYEPKDRVVQSVEPSATMIFQRPADAAPCLLGSAESLPFEDDSFDAALAVLTIHHWSDWRAGLREMRRVARDRVVLVTFDAETSDFWLTRDYFPELLTLDRKIMPTMPELASLLGQFHTIPLPVPHDCLDGFFGAYWRRPEIYLDPVARASMSPFTTIDPSEGLSRLASDLQNGSWHKRNADLLALDAFDLGYRLLRWEKSWQGENQTAIGTYNQDVEQNGCFRDQSRSF